MPTVTIDHNGQLSQTSVAAGATLAEALHAGGIELSLPCGGQHTCGKCRVWAQGRLSPMSERERQLLGDAPQGQRLACFTVVEGDCSLRTQTGGTDRILADYRADALPPAPIYPGAYGVAVDIGTTTVVGYLFERTKAAPIAVQGALNSQRTFGADVLSRIAYCNEHTVAPLQEAIRRQLDSLLQSLCQGAGIAPEALSGLCVTGNTTMLHLLAGLEPRSLALAPFTPQSVFGDWHDLALPHFPGLRAYLPQCISAYVGADITCSVLSSGIAASDKNVLLVDIGTNGEMVLHTPEGVIGTSTAAGPAFEGSGISAGMSAQSGAISSVWAEKGQVRFTTVDDAPPVGLCGSGLVDSMAAFLELGILDKRGRMADSFGGRAPLGDSGVFVTQKDVRQFQLAKGAIRGGMDVLLHHCGLSYEALDQIVLCGGFGSYLNVTSAQAIGLIPPDMAGRTVAIGNAAGAGAGNILQNTARQAQALQIASAVRAIDLSTDAYFKKRYVEAMLF